VFREVSAGDKRTCGGATDGRAHCWGSGFPGRLHLCPHDRRPGLVLGEGDVGRLGVGRVLTSFWSRRVAGGLSFDRAWQRRSSLTAQPAGGSGNHGLGMQTGRHCGRPVVSS
jgi:hypothetical protein